MVFGQEPAFARYFYRATATDAFRQHLDERNVWSFTKVFVARKVIIIFGVVVCSQILPLNVDNISEVEFRFRVVG
jgi:hypothetical protein